LILILLIVLDIKVFNQGKFWY